MTEFRVSVDWLSASLLLSTPTRTTKDDRLSDVIISVTGNFGTWIECSGPAKKSRRPYTDAIVLMIRGTNIRAGKAFYNPKLDHYLIEITGSGCQNIQDQGEMSHFMAMVAQAAYNVTRIDIATDFKTDILPAEFAASVSERWQSKASENSATGKTEYIGSRKSDKYAKVYRYNPPHPRADLLRIEVTLKKKAGALAVVRRIANGEALEYISADVNVPFGWGHELWCFEGERMMQSRPDNDAADTLRWLRSAVIPSIRRLWQDGEVPQDDDIWYEILVALPPK